MAPTTVWKLRGEVLERRVEMEEPLHNSGFDEEVLRDLDDALHALSQPITVLLCTLELGQSLNSVEEIKPLLLAAREASERLRQTSLAMRARLQVALRRA